MKFVVVLVLVVLPGCRKLVVIAIQVAAEFVVAVPAAAGIVAELAAIVAAQTGTAVAVRMPVLAVAAMFAAELAGIVVVPGLTKGFVLPVQVAAKPARAVVGIEAAELATALQLVVAG